jgi:hypothetical protein
MISRASARKGTCGRSPGRLQGDGIGCRQWAPRTRQGSGVGQSPQDRRHPRHGAEPLGRNKSWRPRYADRRGDHAPDVALLDQIPQQALVGFLNGQSAARYQRHWQQRRAPWSIAKESSARERSIDSGRTKLPFQQTAAPVPIGSAFRSSARACRSVRFGDRQRYRCLRTKYAGRTARRLAAKARSS